MWLAIANMDSAPETITIKSLDGKSSKTINLPAERLTILQYNNTVDLPGIVNINGRAGTSNIQH
jgi:hypothetical protein